jgi:hypothetical protein
VTLNPLSSLYPDQPPLLDEELALAFELELELLVEDLEVVLAPMVPIDDKACPWL